MKDIYKLIFLAAAPIMLTIIGSSVAAVVDSAVLGKFLGETALAASGVCSPVFSFSAMMGLGFSAALETVCFKLLGLGKKKEAQRLYSSIVVILFVSSVVICALMLVFHQQIVWFMSGFSSDENLLHYSDQYYIGLVLGFVFSVMRFVLMPSAILNGKNKILSSSIVISALLNCVLDIVFTLVFELGIIGIGIGTAVSHFVLFIFLVPQYFNKKNAIHFVIAKFSWNEIISVIKNCLPTVVRQFSHVFNKIAITYILLFFTTATTLAAFSAMTSLKYLIVASSDGLGSASLMLLSYAIGEKNHKFFKKILNASVRAIPIAIIPFAILIALLTPLLALMFSDFGSDLYYQIIIYIVCLCCSLPFYAYTAIYQNLYQAVEKLWASNAICFLQRFVVYLAVNLILTMLFGAIGSAIGIVVSELLCALICRLFYVFSVEKSHHIESLIKVDSTFNTDVTSSKNLPDAVKEAEGFLLNHNLDKSQVLKICLFIEEICAHIIENGFHSEGKNYIKISLMLVSDELAINIKDNCQNFSLYRNKSDVIVGFNEMTAGLRYVIMSSNYLNIIDLLGINCVMIKYRLS